MDQLVIVGAGGLAREVCWLARDVLQAHPGAFDLLGFIDGREPGPLLGLPVLGDDAWALGQLDPGRTRFVLALGSSPLRATLAPLYEQAGFVPLTLIHPSVRIGPAVQIGPGGILCAGSSLTTGIQLGRYSLVNLHCTLGHDSSLGDFVTLSPGVHLSGGSILENGCEIGTGAVVLPGLRLGENVRLGAGAVAHRDLPAGGTYVGVPARRVGGR